MDKDPEIVVVHRAKTPAIAAMIAEALKGAGVPAYVEGAALNDEFAVSQRAMGLTGVEVLVHRDRLEEARKILAAMRASGDHLAEDLTPEEGDQ